MTNSLLWAPDLNAPDAAESECDAKAEGTNGNCDEPKNVHVLDKDIGISAGKRSGLDTVLRRIRKTL